jgi:DNA-binding NarL/FixJ family response regulator
MQQSAARTRIVVLSAHANEAYVAEVLRAGVSGYVLKKSAAGELVAAIHASLAGQTYLSSDFPPDAVARMTWPLSTAVADVFTTLTPRERQVLGLLAQGLTNSQVATRLHIGRRTVETYRSNIMRKLRLSTLADLVRLAVERGLIPPQ